MGLFDDVWGFLAGTKTKSSQKGTSTTNVDQQQTSVQLGQQTQAQTQQQSQTGSQTQAQTGTTTTSGTAVTEGRTGTSGTAATTGTATTRGVTSTLDAGTLGVLQQLVQSLGGNVGQSADADAIRMLTKRQTELNDPGDVEAQIASTQAEAKRQFKQGTASSIAQVQQQIGSRGNSFSALLEEQGQVDLATSLAKVASDIRANAKNQEASNLANAIQGISTAAQVGQMPLETLLSAISVLKGATVETGQTQVSDQSQSSNQVQTSSQSQNSQQTQLADIISQLTSAMQGTTNLAGVTSNVELSNTQANQQTDVVSQQSGKGQTTPGLIPTLTSIITSLK